MKKIVTGILILSMSLGILILCGCQKQSPLPVPEYPLDAEMIDKALQESGLSYIIQEDDGVWEIQPKHSIYSLYQSEKDKVLIGSILSYQKGSERSFSITFPPFYSANALPLEECEDAIVLATLLFGGFNNANQIYDQFIRDYDQVNTKGVQYVTAGGGSTPIHEGESRWKSDIGNATCRIDLVQPTLNEPQEYLTSIVIVSDWDTFFLD